MRRSDRILNSTLMRWFLALAALVGFVAVVGGWTAVVWKWAQAAVTPAPSAEQQAAQQMRCENETDLSVVQGSVGVANVSAGDERYSQAIDVQPGQLLKFQVFVRNRELVLDAQNLRVRLDVPSEPSRSSQVWASICGSNTSLIRDNTIVRSSGGDMHLEFVPHSVTVRTTIGGVPVDRGGSDDIVSQDGESLGRLPATPAGVEDANDLNITALFQVVAGSSAHG